MTAKQVFEYALVELNKKDAPSLLLEDYNYFINKAANQYINKMYNAYDVNQQKTDDLRVLKSSAILTPSLSTEWSASNLLDKTYQVDLPDDYLHILNCVVEYTVLKNYKCYNAGTPWQQGAKRITADMWSQLIHNYYLRPSYKNPYFYINNINVNNNFPTSDNQINITIPINSQLQDISTTFVDSSGTISSPLLVGYYGISSNIVIKVPAPNIYPLLIPRTSITESTVQRLRASGEVRDVSKWTSSIPNFFSSLNIVVGTFIIITSTGIPIGNLDHAITVLGVEDNGSSIVLEHSPLLLDNVDLANIYYYPTVQSLGSADHLNNYQREEPNRYGNSSKVRMEVRYGKDNSTFQLSKVYIDYLKTPQFIRLTQDEIDEVEDISQILEFPDYVCQEIVNELVKLLLENSSDPRLQTNIPINQSIAQPQSQQAPQKR